MKKYLDALKQRAGLSLLVCQLALIMYQLWNLGEPKVTVCSPAPHLNQIICVEQ